MNNKFNVTNVHNIDERNKKLINNNHENSKTAYRYHGMYVCTQRRLIVSPVKNNENFRLNGIVSSSVSSSLLLNVSSPKIMVRE